ncbi:MAG: hypothetical protein AAGH45_07785 [Pseudomonadota bacterium]
MTAFDGLVVGAGLEEWCAAAVLAKAGQRVCLTDFWPIDGVLPTGEAPSPREVLSQSGTRAPADEADPLPPSTTGYMLSQRLAHHFGLPQTIGMHVRPAGMLYVDTSGAGVFRCADPRQTAHFLARFDQADGERWHAYLHDVAMARRQAVAGSPATAHSEEAFFSTPGARLQSLEALWRVYTQSFDQFLERTFTSPLIRRALTTRPALLARLRGVEDLSLAGTASLALADPMTVLGVAASGAGEPVFAAFEPADTPHLTQRLRTLILQAGGAIHLDRPITDLIGSGTQGAMVRRDEGADLTARMGLVRSSLGALMASHANREEGAQSLMRQGASQAATTLVLRFDAGFDAPLIPPAYRPFTGWLDIAEDDPQSGAFFACDVMSKTGDGAVASEITVRWVDGVRAPWQSDDLDADSVAKRLLALLDDVWPGAKSRLVEVRQGHRPCVLAGQAPDPLPLGAGLTSQSPSAWHAGLPPGFVPIGEGFAEALVDGRAGARAGEIALSSSTAKGGAAA